MVFLMNGSDCCSGNPLNTLLYSDTFFCWNLAGVAHLPPQEHYNNRLIGTLIRADRESSTCNTYTSTESPSFMPKYVKKRNQLMSTHTRPLILAASLTCSPLSRSQFRDTRLVELFPKNSPKQRTSITHNEREGERFTLYMQSPFLRE